MPRGAVNHSSVLLDLSLVPSLININEKNLLSLVIIGAFWLCFILACSNSPSTVEDYQKGSRKTYEILPETEKQSLMEDLHDAAGRGDNETLRKVLNRGIPPDATPPGWWTPMMEAAGKGHSIIIQSLLEFGADVNHSNDVGLTPLMIAAINKRPEIIKLLLEAKANVNLNDKNGDTALYKAQMAFCDECVDLLMKAGGTSSISPRVYEKLRKNDKR
jgi:ankyrin repeat protein